MRNCSDGANIAIRRPEIRPSWESSSAQMRSACKAGRCMGLDVKASPG